MMMNFRISFIGMAWLHTILNPLQSIQVHQQLCLRHI